MAPEKWTDRLRSAPSTKDTKLSKAEEERRIANVGGGSKLKRLDPHPEEHLVANRTKVTSMAPTVKKEKEKDESLAKEMVPVQPAELSTAEKPKQSASWFSRLSSTLIGTSTEKVSNTATTSAPDRNSQPVVALSSSAQADRVATSTSSAIAFTRGDGPAKPRKPAITPESRQVLSCVMSANEHVSTSLICPSLWLIFNLIRVCFRYIYTIRYCSNLLRFDD